MLFFLSLLLFSAPMTLIRGDGGLNGCKVLDLTHALNPKNPTFPGFDIFDWKPAVRGPYGGAPYIYGNRYATMEHLGTHIDAPAHFSPSGDTIDNVPMERLIGEACVVDVRDKVARDPSYAVSREDLQEWEKVHGQLDQSCIVLLQTGRAAVWPDPAPYFGTRQPNDLATFNFPGFSVHAALLLVERTVKGVGIDAPSLDSSRTKAFGAHQVLLRDGS